MYDELIAKINSDVKPVVSVNSIIKHYKALRAVMLLHKPQDITLPNGEWGVNCSHCDLWTYPCPTIEAVAKELDDSQAN
jgi:hypothetical protein